MKAFDLDTSILSILVRFNNRRVWKRVAGRYEFILYWNSDVECT